MAEPGNKGAGSPLTLAFMDAQPAAAAAVLEDMPAEDAGALFAAVPARIGGVAMSHMAPVAVARCLDHVEPPHAAGLIRELAFLDAVSVMRQLTPEVRDALSQDLPAGLARDFRIALTYPPGTVGAVMDQTAVAVAPDRTVEDMLNLVRRRRRRHLDYLFVIDGKRRFLGMVRAGDLVRADGRTKMESLMDKVPQTVSSRATLASVFAHRLWDSYLVLPVAGRRGTFVGALNKQALRAGLADLRRARGAVLKEDSMAGNLVGAYLVTCAGLLRTIAHVDDPGPAAMGPDTLEAADVR